MLGSEEGDFVGPEDGDGLLLVEKGVSEDGSDEDGAVLGLGLSVNISPERLVGDSVETKLLGRQVGDFVGLADGEGGGSLVVGVSEDGSMEDAITGEDVGDPLRGDEDGALLGVSIGFSVGI